jgi:hypothetical protein
MKMSADDEEHSESEFYYRTKDITLPIALIETTFYLTASFACGRGGCGNPEEEKKKKKNIYRYGRSV